MTPTSAAARTSRLRASLDGRIPGLDLARALALIGMIGAHVGDDGTSGSGSGWPWLWIVHGRSSALFAVLAGVAIALMARRTTQSTRYIAARIGTRGALLMLFGYALSLLGTPIDVVLTNLGLMFVLVLPTLRLPPAALLAGAALAFTAGSAVARTFTDALLYLPVAEKLVSYHYPAVAWIGYVWVGMAVGRAPLARGATAIPLAAWGATAAVIGYGGGIVLGSPTPWSGDSASAWYSVTPHSNATLELVGNAGFAVLAIAACLAVARTSWWQAPLLAFGTMSLTVYSAHIAVIAMAGDGVVWQPSNAFYTALTGSLILAATAWRAWRGTGPLEQGVTRLSTDTADALVGRSRI